MNEYRIKISVRNNLILDAIEKVGYTSIQRFCRDKNISVSGVTALIALKTPPIMRCGSFSSIANQLMEELCALPTELWTAEQLTMSLKHNTSFRNVGKEELQLSSDEALKLVFDREKEEKVAEVLETMTPRNKKVLEMRYGIGGGEPLTLEEIATAFSVTKERIRQIELHAIRDLKREDSRVILEGLRES
jgi:RNA polymerase sigma factor (sigma-70 family)